MERTRGAATRGTRGIAVARISQRLVHGSQLIESGGRVLFQRISPDYCLLHSFTSNASLDWTGWRNLRRLVDPFIPEHPPNIRLHCRASEGEVKFVRES